MARFSCPHWAACALLAIGCSSSGGAVPGNGRDSGIQTGPTSDGGTAPEGASLSDGGLNLDAGGSDSGDTPSDAASGPDSVALWELDWASPQGPTSKCALSNDPLITTGLLLYQITGDNSYLPKTQNMYGWMKSHLVASDGHVNGCWAFNGSGDKVGAVQGGGSDNAYDTGSFVEAAEYYYRITESQSFYNDAFAAVKHRTTKDKILHDGEDGRAGTERGGQRQHPLCTSSAAAIWQLLPQSPNAALLGTFELKNAHSSLSTHCAKWGRRVRWKPRSSGRVRRLHEGPIRNNLIKTT